MIEIKNFTKSYKKDKKIIDNLSLVSFKMPHSSSWYFTYKGLFKLHQKHLFINYLPLGLDNKLLSCPSISNNIILLSIPQP